MRVKDLIMGFTRDDMCDCDKRTRFENAILDLITVCNMAVLSDWPDHFAELVANTGVDKYDDYDIKGVNFE